MPRAFLIKKHSKKPRLPGTVPCSPGTVPCSPGTPPSSPSVETGRCTGVENRTPSRVDGTDCVEPETPSRVDGTDCVEPETPSRVERGDCLEPQTPSRVDGTDCAEEQTTNGHHNRFHGKLHLTRSIPILRIAPYHYFNVCSERTHTHS